MLERNFTSLPRVPDFIIILRRNILLFYLKHNQNWWSETLPILDTQMRKGISYQAGAIIRNGTKIPRP